ncbi:nucleotide sugar dehydrogenase [Pelotomaculum propionicicum]|uniref:nucleotide sugar dehydrogenase n=1 Tax=Pelotomaculum propionicicum TaxID=258475 RepID=UPI003B7E2023
MTVYVNRDSADNFWVDNLKKAIKTRAARVCVIGLGYVGLPLAVEKGKVGFPVLGIDQDAVKVKQINEGLNYNHDVSDGDLLQLVRSGSLKATCDYNQIKDQDIIIICVPTPLNKHREPDISSIEDAATEIMKRLEPGKVIILESTTYPGTTEEVVLPLMESTGLKAGKDFFLVYSPERVDPGNKRYTTSNTSKVVGGVTPACLDVAKYFYSQTIVNVVPVSSPAVAEMTKVFENTYRAVNIALVNELMMLCDKMDINVWEVVDAAGTKPFGIQTFYPGPGVGGHCIPVDPFYLGWKARQYDFPTRFIELAGEINIQASYYVVNKVIRALNSKEKSMKNARILVLGVAYKKDVSDYRESPALTIMRELQDYGANVVFFDPYVEALYGYPYERVELDTGELSSCDCVLILADHTNVDYEKVVSCANLVIDTKNATKKIKTGQKKVVLI